jgi:branched-chain amino acid transport system substrate-binding protein
MPFAGVLAKQIRESGWNVAIGATGDFVTTDFGQFLGPAANGLIMTDTGHYKCALKRKVGKPWVTAWQKQFNRPPGANEIAGADAIGVIAAAIRKARSTDGQKMVDALHRMSYNGIRFAEQWDAKGNLKHTPIPIVVWAKNGTQLNNVMCDVQPVVHLKKP